MVQGAVQISDQHGCCQFWIICELIHVKSLSGPFEFLKKYSDKILESV
jgi:hypothetical protein